MGRVLRRSVVWLFAATTPALAQSPDSGANPAVDAAVESFELSDARALVTACTVPADNPLHQTAKGFCLGYMTGAMQLYRAATASPKIKNHVCPGHVVSRAEMRDVFLEWAAANPQMLSEPAVDGLLRAAVAKFPCPS